MIEIDNILVSEEIINRYFACDIKKCNGFCCVYGDAGAPLEKEEVFILEQYLDDIKPYLTDEGNRSIKKQGVFVKDDDGDLVTPLIEGKECAYTVFSQGVALCGIEQAFFDGKIDFRKPISCHLYPIRIGALRQGKEFLIYHKWEICGDACTLGKRNKTPIYRFTKDALIRKYGKEWYDKLSAAADYLSNE